MLKVFATNLIVSKGYENNPALKYFGENDSCVQFRVGEKVYDKDAENNTRWVNHTVKAFGAACERIKKMQLKEGSFINITGGTLTDETWTDNGTVKHAQVIVLEGRDSIEYASGGGKKPAGDGKSDGGDKSSDKKKKPESSDNFTGYEGFGGNSFFDED